MTLRVIRHNSAMKLALWACFVPALFGAQSLVLSPGQVGPFSVPSKPAFTNAQSLRIELRMHNWTSPSSPTDVFTMAGLIEIQLNGKLISILENAAQFTSGQGIGVSLDLSNRPDFMLRIQRDVTNKILTAEIWNIDGSNYASSSVNYDSVVLQDLSKLNSWVGGNQTSASLALLRMYSSILPSHSKVSVAPDADLLDWEFENSLVDSAYQTRISSIKPVYVTTPVYPPACSAGAPQTFRVGFPATLDGSLSAPLDGSTSLTYAWTSLGQPLGTTGIASNANPSLAQAGFVPDHFGTYVFQLTVTDGSNQSSTCSVKHGAVVTDDNGAILFSDPNIGALFSPSIRLGLSPWPWYDNRHQTLADFFGALQATDYQDSWNVALAGTISVSNNSAVVTGTGTTFQSSFCAGGSQSDGSAFIVWYPLPNVSDHFGRSAFSVKSCDSDTQITLTQPYTSSPGSPGTLSYSKMTVAQIGIWIGNSSNVNFYDNVMAFYALYYRSGIDTYLNYARTLADRWWTQPWIDEGRSCALDGSTPCLAPRNRAMMGLVARAVDGRPDMWPGLRHLCIADRYFVRQPGPLYDIREQGYQLNEISLCALLDPDPAQRAAFATDVVAALEGLWIPYQQQQGHWLTATYGVSPWNGQPGSVTVTSGSTTVQGVGTQWTADQFPSSSAFWISAAPTNAWNGDSATYTATFVDATHLQLDRSYAGDNAGPNRGWESNNLVGPGTQPFMMGVVSSALNTAYLATGDIRALKIMANAAYWIANYGYRSSVRGLYYGRYFPNCEPIQENVKNCSDDSASSARLFAGEVLNAFSRAYAFTGDPTLRDMGDNLFSALFGKTGFGGPMSDGLYDTEIDDGGLSMQTKRAKDFGFLFGFGQGWSWLEARLTEPAPLARMKFDLRVVPGSATVQAYAEKKGMQDLQEPLSCKDSFCLFTDRACPVPACLIKLNYLSSQQQILATRLTLVHR